MESDRLTDGNVSLEESVTNSDASILREPAVAPIPAEHVMARNLSVNTTSDSPELNSPEARNQPEQTERLAKHEWL